MPMNRALYPPDWPEISRRVREEAGQKCEWCGLANGAIGYRERSGSFVRLDELTEMQCQEERCIRIVLTVAHIDRNPANNERTNLAALCQRCHLRHDHEQHQASAAATRARKRLAALTGAGQQGLL